ncbi:MAG: PKD domain-containing protein, partial [Flavobacteriales bacterium]
ADDQVCALSYNLQAVASYGNGSWTGGPIGTAFAPNPNTPNATVTVPSAGTHTFTWTEDNGIGCTDSDVVDISFSDMSIPAVITNASCAAADGQIVVAPQEGVPAYTYAWTSGGNTAIEMNLGPGNVTVTVTDAIGCSLDSTFTITQPVGFNVAINTANETCFGLCDGQLEMLPDGAGPYTYAWTPNVSTANMEIDLCQDDYEVLITDIDGCTETVNATIGGPTQVVAVLSSDVSQICIGGSAVLSANVTGGTMPYATYTWVANPADPTLISTDQNPTVSPLVTTTYTLVVTDANGCPSDPQDIIIDVLPPLTLDVIRPLISPDTSICPYDFATLNLVAGGGDGNYNIYLLPDIINPITLPLDTQPLVTTTFDFTVIDGCTTPPAFVSSTVTIHPLPTVLIEAEPDSGCHPLTVQFTDLTMPSPASWSWNFGDPDGASNSSTSQNPEHLYSGAGLYDVSLSIVTTEGCVADSTFEDFIEVFPLPYANFSLTPEITNLLDADVLFTDLSTGNIADWRW